MMSITLLSHLLKSQTQTQHQALEREMIPLLKAIKTQADYTHILMLFHTFFGGIELLVDSIRNPDHIPDYQQRRKTASLVNDLQVLKAPLHPIAGITDLPSIKNEMQCLGAMYVMEGSTLGGQHISKMISERLSTLHPAALTFFEGYQERTQEMWNSFKMALDGINMSTTEQGMVVAAANDTFTCFSKWIISLKKT